MNDTKNNDGNTEDDIIGKSTRSSRSGVRRRGRQRASSVDGTSRTARDGSVGSVGSRGSQTSSYTNGVGSISEGGGGTSDYAMKEATLEFLSLLSDCLQRPLILFIDDLQWADPPSLEMLQFILSSRRWKNAMVICAYRSNEVVGRDHPFRLVMESVGKARKDADHHESDDATIATISTIPSIISTATSAKNEDHQTSLANDVASTIHIKKKISVQKMDLYNLSPDTVATFIADCIGKEKGDVESLAGVVYQKTMGNIFYVKQVLEELVRKNALYYDMMTFEWQWSVTDKVQLSDFISDDVVETVKGKLNDLPLPMQRLLIVMSYIPNSLDERMLKKLINNEGFVMESTELTMLLRQACNEGMAIYSSAEMNHTYDLAHDRIRQACREFNSEEERYDLLVRISSVLKKIKLGPTTEWCLYVAVDHLNSLPPTKTNQGELAKMNLRASKVAKKRSAAVKENLLLRKGRKCLESSDIVWKDYDFTLELYNAVIVSEYSIGHLKDALEAIDTVQKNARTLEDKFTACLNKVKCHCDETRDYGVGCEEAIGVLKVYGYDIPLCPSKADVVKEEMMMNIGLRKRPYSYLASLPLRNQPIVEVFGYLVKCALLSGKDRLLNLAALKAMRCSLEKGVDKHLPGLIVALGALYNKKGKVKKAYAFGNIAVLMVERFKDHKEIYAYTKFVAYGSTMAHMESFQKGSEVLIKCSNDLKLVGQFELALGSALNYFHAHLAAGLPLNSLLESKLIAAEDFARTAGKNTFVDTFLMLRKLVQHFRKTTTTPTEIKMDAKKGANPISSMTSSQSLRDVSSCQLMLAVIYWNEDSMASMLDVLAPYPLADVAVPRQHNRLTFVGLAAFAMGRLRNDDVFMDLGETCLTYFKKLAKIFSVNAIPVYALLKAIKNQTHQHFEKAVDACMESGVTHLTAIACERFGKFLLENDKKNLGEEYISSAYWFYNDWGAHGKTSSMRNEHRFLLGINRRTSFMKKSHSAQSASAPPSQAVHEKKTKKSARFTFSSSREFNAGSVRGTSSSSVLRIQRLWGTNNSK